MSLRAQRILKRAWSVNSRHRPAQKRAVERLGRSAWISKPLKGRCRKRPIRSSLPHAICIKLRVNKRVAVGHTSETHTRTRLVVRAVAVVLVSARTTGARKQRVVGAEAVTVTLDPHATHSMRLLRYLRHTWTPRPVLHIAKLRSEALFKLVHMLLPGDH